MVSGQSLRRNSTLESRKKHFFGRGGSSRKLHLEALEHRCLLAVTWSGPGNALSLTEGTSGATRTVAISEPSVSLLKIDLGAGSSFDPARRPPRRD
jgi:hypothetical protein